MKVYLVRHGETYWNERNLIQGNVDVGLNESGRRQSRELAESFPAHGEFDLAVSPLRRARETARELREQLSVGAHWVIDEFRELNQGCWNGLNYEQVKKFSPDKYNDWDQNPVEISPPRGESLSAVRDRVHTGLEVLQEQSENPVVLVAHKVINSVVASLAGRWPLDEVLDSLPENAAVFEVRLNLSQGD